MDGPDDALVWYVAYGSNLAAARFRCYLEGGRPDGARRALPGCRDRSWPVEWRSVLITGAVYFALESPTWTGGMAFYDPDGFGQVPARAWLISRQQFGDVLHQEMHRDLGVDVDLAALADGKRVAVGPGRYETLVHLGDLDGHPMITFTCPWRADEVEHTRPHPTYLRIIEDGRREIGPAERP